MTLKFIKQDIIYEDMVTGLSQNDQELDNRIINQKRNENLQNEIKERLNLLSY